MRGVASVSSPPVVAGSARRPPSPPFFLSSEPTMVRSCRSNPPQPPAPLSFSTSMGKTGPRVGLARLPGVAAGHQPPPVVVVAGHQPPPAGVTAPLASGFVEEAASQTAAASAQGATGGLQSSLVGAQGDASSLQTSPVGAHGATAGAQASVPGLQATAAGGDSSQQQPRTRVTNKRARDEMGQVEKGLHCKEEINEEANGCCFPFKYGNDQHGCRVVEEDNKDGEHYVGDQVYYVEEPGSQELFDQDYQQYGDYLENY